MSNSGNEGGQSEDPQKSQGWQAPDWTPPGDARLPPPPPPPPHPPQSGSEWADPRGSPDQSQRGQGQAFQQWGQQSNWANGVGSGPLPLRPMTFSDILDGAFQLFKANAVALVTIVAVLAGPVQLVGAFLGRNALIGKNGIASILSKAGVAGLSQQSRGHVHVIASIFVLLLGVVSSAVMAAAIVRLVADSYLGLQTAAGDAMRWSLRRTGRLVTSRLLSLPLYVGGAVLCFFPLFAVMAFMFVRVPALVVEDLGPLKSIKRSSRLVSSRFWQAFSVSCLIGIIAGILGLILSVIPSTIGQVMGPDFGWIVVAMGGFLSAGLTVPITVIAATLFYFDTRIRTEGFDLQVMAANLGSIDRTPS